MPGSVSPVGRGSSVRHCRLCVERAVSPETSAFLKVHKSNYDIIGFTREVSLAELVELVSIQIHQTLIYK